MLKTLLSKLNITGILFAFLCITLGVFGIMLTVQLSAVINIMLFNLLTSHQYGIDPGMIMNSPVYAIAITFLIVFGTSYGGVIITNRSKENPLFNVVALACFYGLVFYLLNKLAIFFVPEAADSETSVLSFAPLIVVGGWYYLRKRGRLKELKSNEKNVPWFMCFFMVLLDFGLSSVAGVLFIAVYSLATFTELSVLQENLHTNTIALNYFLIVGTLISAIIARYISQYSKEAGVRNGLIAFVMLYGLTLLFQSSLDDKFPTWFHATGVLFTLTVYLAVPLYYQHFAQKK